MFALATRGLQDMYFFLPAPIVLDANGAPRRHPDAAPDAPSHESPAHDQWVT
jgi:hypothetical protein